MGEVGGTSRWKQTRYAHLEMRLIPTLSRPGNATTLSYGVGGSSLSAHRRTPESAFLANKFLTIDATIAGPASFLRRATPQTNGSCLPPPPPPPHFGTGHVLTEAVFFKSANLHFEQLYTVCQLRATRGCEGRTLKKG